VIPNAATAARGYVEVKIRKTSAESREGGWCPTLRNRTDLISGPGEGGGGIVVNCHETSKKETGIPIRSERATRLGSAWAEGEGKQEFIQLRCIPQRNGKHINRFGLPR